MTSKRPPSRRHALNVSTKAGAKFCRVKERLYELDVPWDITDSTTVEFMADRLLDDEFDILAWRPATQDQRRRRHDAKMTIYKNNNFRNNQKIERLFLSRQKAREKNLALIKDLEEHPAKMKAKMAELCRNRARVRDAEEAREEG